jgi:uncharacterized protein YaaW (UPF0174 family)
MLQANEIKGYGESDTVEQMELTILERIFSKILDGKSNSERNALLKEVGVPQDDTREMPSIRPDVAFQSAIRSNILTGNAVIATAKQCRLKVGFVYFYLGTIACSGGPFGGMMSNSLNSEYSRIVPCVAYIAFLRQKFIAENRL